MEEQIVVEAVSASATSGPVLAAALLGGALTGIFTLLGVIIAYHLARRSQSKQEQAVINGFLQAVLDEIETLWQRYMDGMGVKVESLNEGEILPIYPVLNDYFTVYHGNAFLLGRVQDDDLRKAIVTTYTGAKGLLDSFGMSNVIIQKAEAAYDAFGVTNTDFYKAKADAEFNRAAQYAVAVKKSHNETKKHVSELLRELRKALKKAG